MLAALAKAKKTKSPFDNRLGKDIIGFVNQYKIYGHYFSSHAKRLVILSNILSSGERHLNELKAI